MVKKFLLWLIINFAALGIGGLFTNTGVTSDWYDRLAKAPWTPPGWVFGAAWTSIMICFAIYMTKCWAQAKSTKQLLFLYLFQWALNVGWNPVFFYFHQVFAALIIIVLLTILIGFLILYYRKLAGVYTLFLLPYFIWLLIATSLNAYVLLNN